MVSLDDDSAWQEVCLEGISGGQESSSRSTQHGEGELLAKLGWSLVRRRRDGCWVTDALSWHDFRMEFRPGIGEVEWDRSFG